MLTWRRRHESTSERAWIVRYIAGLPHGEPFADAAGNWWFHIPGNGDRVLWTAHTDTVHCGEGRQHVDVRHGVVDLALGGDSCCLGADDGVGCWVMRQMILAGHPGRYVFQRGEECSGIGSTWVADNRAEWLGEVVDAVVSLDRRATTSVITHQMGRTCSDAFGESLALALGATWRKDPTGSFTDSANYVKIVGECSNLSVGYAHEHTRLETADLMAADALLDALLALDTCTLVYERKPGASGWYDDPWDGYYDRLPGGVLGARSWAPHGNTARGADVDGRPLDGQAEHVALLALVRKYPNEVANLMTEYGITSGDVLAELDEWDTEYEASHTPEPDPVSEPDDSEPDPAPAPANGFLSHIPRLLGYGGA